MLIFEIMISKVPFFIFFSSGPKTFLLFTLTSTLRFCLCALNMSKSVPVAGIGSGCSSVGLPDRKCFEQMYVYLFSLATAKCFLLQSLTHLWHFSSCIIGFGNGNHENPSICSFSAYRVSRKV